MTDRLERMPFAQLLGIELAAADEGRAVGRLPLTEQLTSNPSSGLAHGAVPYALADTVAGAAVSTLNETVTPTVDMRIDYLRPAVGNALEAEAEVVRNGSTVATVDVIVRTETGDVVATARGTFKTSGASGETPWESGAGVGGAE